MTNREKFEVLKGMVEVSNAENKTELVEFLTKQIEILDRKSSAVSAKSAEKKAENDNLKVQVLEALVNFGKPVTVKEVMGVIPNLSNQKITYLLKSLVLDNKAVRSEIKKIPYYNAV
jgi:hypothetical protein